MSGVQGDCHTNPGLALVSEDLKKKIHEIPGDDGWWKQSGCQGFIEIAKRLSTLGVSEEAILEMLSSTYGIVSEEYGG